MDQTISDISSFVVNESGAFPSVNALENVAAANRHAIKKEMKQVEKKVQPVIRKLLEGSIEKLEALKDIRNILQERIDLADLREVLSDALSEHPELMVGGKRKTRRGKRRGSKNTRRTKHQPKRGKKKTRRGRKSRRS